MGGGERASELDEVDIHRVLSNERRRYIIRYLRDAGGSLSVRELSERIATVETGESPPPANIRQSAYVSLHQTHLPKLDELGIVEYDSSGSEVRLTEQADQLRVYMEVVPTFGLAWSEFYIAVSLLGLLFIIAAEVGVPVLTAVGSLALAVMTFVILMASAAYQTVTQRSSILHRLVESPE